MPAVSRAQTVRRMTGQPAHFQPAWLRDRHSLPRTGGSCLLDTRGTADILPPRLWWPGRALARFRQTGNTGVNPGRPRRCDQAPRPAVSKPLRSAACRDPREKACSRPSLGVRRPTRDAEQAFLARAGRQARARRRDPPWPDIRLFTDSRLLVVGPPRVAPPFEAALSQRLRLGRLRRCAWIRGISTGRLWLRAGA